jgi:hypothetical protein
VVKPQNISRRIPIMAGCGASSTALGIQAGFVAKPSHRWTASCRSCRITTNPPRKVRYRHFKAINERWETYRAFFPGDAWPVSRACRFCL